MTPDNLHWIVTVALGVVAWLLRDKDAALKTELTLKASASDLQTARADVSALQTQNGIQEREIATLKADQLAHGSSSERLERAVERLEEKFDALMSHGALPTRSRPRRRATNDR